MKRGWMFGAAALLMVGCGSNGEPADEGMTDRLDSAYSASFDTAKVAAAVGYPIEGTVRAGVEAGCWVIEAADGQVYRPTGEKAEALRQDGLKVRLQVADDPESMSMCMQGKAVRVIVVLNRS